MTKDTDKLRFAWRREKAELEKKLANGQGDMIDSLRVKYADDFGNLPQLSDEAIEDISNSSRQFLANAKASFELLTSLPIEERIELVNRASRQVAAESKRAEFKTVPSNKPKPPSR